MSAVTGGVTGGVTGADVALRSWIVEALAVSGAATPALEVARHVWTHHESDLRAAGDLLLTWQVDLRRVAATMEQVGALAVDGDAWTLTPAGTRPPVAAGPRPWEGTEIAVVVEGYLSLLVAEHEGRVLRRADVLADVVARTGRSGPELERILSNVAHVLQERGIEPLGHWRPRSNVPAGVRPAVDAALAALR